MLVISATDSSGGAGLTRDVRTLTDFCVDALCVVTAVTAQSDTRVAAVHHVPPDVIRAQISAAFETRRVGAIKIGMLGTRATVDVVAECLATAQGDEASVRGDMTSTRAPTAHMPIVLDPVLVSSSGGILLDAAGRASLLEHLLPLATLITPNVPEVGALLGEPAAADEPELIRQGRRLLEYGTRAVLLKGGHATGEEAVDLLVTAANDVERINSKRVTGSSRGTGCALASGIAAGLASGQSLAAACKNAKHYVLERLLMPGRHESEGNAPDSASSHDQC